MKIFLLIAISLLYVDLNHAVSQVSINDADNLFYSLNLNGALDSYQKIYKNNSANIEDRALAGRKLAYISWHLNNDLEKAREIIKNTLKFESYEVYLFSDLVLYESQANNFNKARNVCQEALLSVSSENKVNIINVAYSNLILNEAVYKIKNNQPIDTLLIHNALNKIKIANRFAPGILKSAKIQLGLALLFKDGKEAVNAWNLYFNISSKQKATPLLTKPQKELSRILLSWNKTNLSVEERENVILNLANSGFYEFAYVMSLYLSNKTKTDNPSINDITNYYEFSKQIECRIYKYYLDAALTDENNIKEVKKDIRSIQKTLWSKLNWENKIPAFSSERFYEELYTRFGTKVYSGKFSGYYFYIGGHAIIDKVKTIEQFNKKAEIQFFVLDLRFSNNYWGWFTNNYGFSGYADDAIIVKYREPESSKPLYYWNKLNTNESLSKWKNEIDLLSEQDNSLSKKNKIVSLNGIYERIRLNIYSEIIDSLKSAGFINDELRKQFTSFYNDIEYNHIMNHEGRHAIDFNTLSKIKLLFIDDTDLEYRATLSQVYFSKYPLLDIKFEINNTPHGLANKKLLGHIVNWMEQNEELIEDYDVTKPTLPQLDLLTSEQLRKIIESLEPFFY